MKFDNLTNDELLNIIVEYYKTYGKAPRRHDMLPKNGLPTCTLYFKRFGFLLWRDILNLVDLKTVYKEVIYNKNKLIHILISYSNQLGRIPTFADFKKYNFTPNFNMYSQHFGSYKNACKVAGLINNNINVEDKKLQTITEIKELMDILKRIPTNKEYSDFRKYGYSSSKIKSAFNKTFLQLCKEISPEYSLVKCPSVEEIKQLILNYYNKYNKTPYLKDLEINPCIFKHRVPMTYSEFLTSIGLPCAVDFSDNELLDDFQKLFNKFKRIPTSEEISEYGICHYSTYQYRFGSMKNICDKLNIKYEKFYGTGRVCVDKNNDICKSIAEMTITNCFNDNNIEYIKEPKYSELISCDNRIFDWKIKINNKWYYIEYFGLWLPDRNNKLIKIYINKAKSKIRALYKNNSIDNCIFLFPYHLKNIDNWLKELLELQGYKVIG